MNTPAPTLPGGTWQLGDLTVSRFGYGAMQLAGPGVMGPPVDPTAAVAVLHEAIASGITHIDTALTYGPELVNELIRDTLSPFPSAVHVATKVGAERTPEGGWPPARTPDQLRRQVDENLRTLGVDTLDLVNLRLGNAFGPAPERIDDAFQTLADLQQQGLIRHLGVSNATADQIAAARTIAPIVCVQNGYNLAHRSDDALIDSLAADGIAYVPFFPLGGFNAAQSQTVTSVATRLGVGATAVALAWLLHRSPNVLVIAGTSSVDHLRENLAGAAVVLDERDLRDLDGIGTAPR
ncbi:oxidoreductase [Curtobacterium sp. MCPF17_002]|uniref:oxidoreductase n=1 Tax=Curtobacterium sp. MCPF17_002 TaxID=2175645 RepID=UPI000DAA2EFC|nr:oxidoreductase [Curtobacterium sp. MCPF17_002]WIB78996.1 oxidoreductase [Curtobacterium sp. MCPF17_002]